MEKRLTKAQAQERIEKLKKYIEEMRYRYHVLDDPGVTDADYDSLMRELVGLEREYPEFYDKNSPTQKVGGEPLKKFVKIRHQTPMISLGDAFNKQELMEWYERIAKLIGKDKLDKSGFFAEIKMDGLAVSLVYEKGELLYGVTRGDGIIGEDVTENIKTIKSIPLRLNSANSKFQVPSSKNIEIRGEVYMSKKTFELLNEERKKKGEVLFANPRNAAAGSIRQLDPKVSASRNLDFMAYSLMGIETETHEEEHKAAQSLGLPSNKYNKFCHSIDEVIKLWGEWERLRPKLSYQIDGMVVVVNSTKLFEELGVVGKSPRGALAFKWPAEEVTTVVEDIIVQVGRTGTLTPVAKLRPVEVAGSTVARATLHNEDEIKRKDIRIGDTVMVRKAGDVIPEVVKPIEKLRTGREKVFQMPEVCSMCGGKVERREGEAAWKCLNKKCFALKRRQLQHFVAKGAFDMVGLGPKIIDRFLEEGLIKSAVDLFKLKVEDIQGLERFEKKSAENLVNSIQGHKKISLAKFIWALGILNVGEETAHDIADVVKRNLKSQISNLKIIEKLQKMTLGEWQEIPDIGPVVAKSIYNYFQNKGNLEFIGDLMKAEVVITDERKAGVPQKLAGEVFVLTGGLKTLTRDEAKEKIRNLGGEVSESVGKKTSYVVVGEEPGEKAEKAKEVEAKLIDEGEFLNLIK